MYLTPRSFWSLSFLLWATGVVSKGFNEVSATIVLAFVCADKLTKNQRDGKGTLREGRT